jgi:hypothetical protein
MAGKPRHSDGEWFAMELGERKRELDQIWVDLEDALTDGMLGMASAQAVALSLHARDLARAIAARPQSAVDAASLG